MRPEIERRAQDVRDGVPMSPDEREWIARLIMAVGQQFYERTGSMFITGYAGEIRSDGLPDVIHVCPTYGADVQCAQAYERAKPVKTL